jgi:tRNA (Thr-GGU) A37 N-methylase
LLPRRLAYQNSRIEDDSHKEPLMGVFNTRVIRRPNPVTYDLMFASEKQSFSSG